MIGSLLRIGIAGDVVLRDVVEQAGDRERLPVAQLDVGFRAPRRERRECGSPGSVMPLAKSSVLTSGRTFRRIMSPAIVGVKFSRMPNSLNMTVTRCRVAALHDRNRELAAGEEAGFLAVVGDEVRLGEALEAARVFRAP